MGLSAMFSLEGGLRHAREKCAIFELYSVAGPVTLPDFERIICIV